MKAILFRLSALLIAFFLTSSFNSVDRNETFQGEAYYFSKSRMNLGNWGSRLSEAQKKQIEANLKNRLEKEYVLLFNKEESVFYEKDKLDAISGATDTWGKMFSPGDQYKNVKTNSQVQEQEFYGKRFLVKDQLQSIEWNMGAETKQIGNYTCFKATASIPTDELTWYSFSWDKLRNREQAEQGDANEENVKMTELEAWYTLQIPVLHGPLEYWGLPGLIMEISAGDTTVLCSKIVMNPENKTKIEAPDKGKVVSKSEYQQIISEKMQEFRDNRMGRR